MPSSAAKPWGQNTPAMPGTSKTPIVLAEGRLHVRLLLQTPPAVASRSCVPGAVNIKGQSISRGSQINFMETFILCAWANCSKTDMRSSKCRLGVEVVGPCYESMTTHHH
jgi:hypothetical protein